MAFKYFPPLLFFSILLAIAFLADTPKIYFNLLTDCSFIFEEKKQIDCVNQIIEKEMKKHDNIAAGIRVFAVAQKAFESFEKKNILACHTWLHTVGDLAYFNLYRFTKDVSSIDFPQETSSCSYGFFHGFIEHLIQDNPDTQFAEKVCGTLIDRLGESMSRIMGACYHGVGHAFVLTRMEKINKQEWNNFYAVVEIPTKQCAQLSLPEFRQKCWQGVFHIFLDDYKYNFYTQNDYEPRKCLVIKPKEASDECYFFLMTDQQFSAPDDLYGAVLSLKDEKLKERIFRYGIINMIHRQTGYSTAHLRYKKILAQCESLEQSFYESCVKGIVKFLSSTTPPTQKMSNSFLICAEPTVLQRGIKSLCYKAVAEKLPEQHSKEQIMSMCKKFPKDVREECKKLL